MPGQNRAGQSPAYRPPTTQGGNSPPPCSCVLQLAYCLLVLDTENVSEVSFRFSSVLILLPFPVSLSLPLLPLLLLFILFCFCCCFVIVNHRNVSWVRVCVCFGASRVLGFVVSTQNLHSVVPLPLPSSSFHLSSAGPPLSPSDIFASFCALLFRLFCGPLTWPEQVEPPDSVLPPQGALNTVRIAKHLQICSACLDYLHTYFHTSSPLMLLAPYVQVTHN